MNLLAFYTASEPASVALRTACSESGSTLERGRQAERLLAVAQDLLREVGLGVRDLEGVAVARGPGSFTGLRVGASAALGLARGADLALYAPGTLEAWAALALVGSVAGAVCGVVLDARRGEIYHAGFRAASPRSEGAAPARDATPARGTASAGPAATASCVHIEQGPSRADADGSRGRAPAEGIALPELFDGPYALAPEEVLVRIEPSALVVGDAREILVRAGLDPARPGFEQPPEPLALALARLVELAPERYARPLEGFTLEYLREPQAVARRGGAGRAGGRS